MPASWQRHWALPGKNGCFLQCASLADQTVEAMLEKADDLTPCMIVVEDVNLPDAGGAVQAALRLKERARAQGLGVYIVLTVQDGPEGLPLSPRLLNHAFLLRMQAPDAGQSWRSVGMKPAPAEKTVELAALKEMVRCGEAVPAVIEERMNRLRQALEKLGYRMDRRTLSDVWAYCAVMTRMGRTEDMETLDMALCHRALPVMLADMELHQLLKLGDLLPDMPRCLALLAEPLPLPPLA